MATMRHKVKVLMINMLLKQIIQMMKSVLYWNPIFIMERKEQAIIRFWKT